MLVKHRFTSAVAEGSNSLKVRTSNWNDSHLIENPIALTCLDYHFDAQTPGGTLSAGITNTITLTPVPTGVNGVDVGHYLYISAGTGTAEAVLITGGTAVSDAASGTITFVPANAHSGAWTIQSSTIGIQEAHNSVAFATGSLIIIPAGDYNLYSQIYISNYYTNIQGAGSRATRLLFTVPNGTDWIKTAFGTSGVRLEDFGMLGPVDVNSRASQTSGYAFKGNTNTYLSIINVTIDGASSGLHLYNPTIALINWISIRNIYPTSGVAIKIEGNDINALSLENVVIDNPAGAAPFAGIYIISCAECYIRNCQIMRAGHGILIDNPAGGDVVSLLVVSDTTLDHCQNSGINIVPQLGTVMRSKFSNIWSCSNGAKGINIDPTGGAVQNCTFESCTVFGNDDVGILVADATYVAINNCYVSHNGVTGASKYGIFLYSGSHLSVTNCFLGKSCETTSEIQTHGLYIDTTPTYLRVVGNEFSSNLTLPLHDASVTLFKVIENNLGLDDLTTETIASGATIDFGVLRRKRYYISGNTPIATINGGYKGERISLFFTHATPGGLTTGGNIATAQTVVQWGKLTLEYDGVGWY